MLQLYENKASPCRDQYAQYCSRIVSWCPSVCNDNCWPASPTTTPAATALPPGNRYI